MKNRPITVTIILKAIALAMGVASLVLSILGTTTPQANITLLSIGLFALALASMQQGPEPE